MRLYKFICDCTGLTRSQAGKSVRQGLVTINGDLVKQAARQVSGLTKMCPTASGRFLTLSHNNAVSSNADP